MTPNIAPMQLGDIFDKTFTLFGRTFTRNARLIAVLFLPSLLLLFLTVGLLLKIVSNGVDPGDIASILGIGLFVVIALACLIVSTAAGEITVIRIVCGEFFGEHFTWREGLEAARSIWLGRAIGATLLRGLIIIGAFLVLFQVNV